MSAHLASREQLRPYGTESVPKCARKPGAKPEHALRFAFTDQLYWCSNLMVLPLYVAQTMRPKGYFCAFGDSFFTG
jgi:hypothetical protein